MAPNSVADKIVIRIADREGVDPVDLTPPLYEVIDTEALEALTTGPRAGQDGSSPTVEFLYYGYSITVDETGSVSITDPGSVTAEVSSAEVESALEPLSAELTHRESALKNAATILGTHDQPFDEQVTDLLEVVRDTLRMEYATLSYVATDTYVFEAIDTPSDVSLQAGTTVPLSYLPACQQVVETEQSLVMSDVEAEAPELVDPTWGISAYLGAPVFVADELYGTFCVYGTVPRLEEFSDWDRTFVELLGTWVSEKLEQRHQTRAVHARTFERSGVK